MIFYLSWIEYFSKICEANITLTSNSIQQSQKCLNIYKSIQNGLGIPFCHYFISFQILIVITLYMCISTAFFGPYDILSNIIVSICYALMFLFCGTTLYFLIIASENAYTSLQKLSKPLNIIVMKEQALDA